jgi:hypothetical protein
MAALASNILSDFQTLFSTARIIKEPVDKNVVESFLTRKADSGRLCYTLSGDVMRCHGKNIYMYPACVLIFENQPVAYLGRDDKYMCVAGSGDNRFLEEFQISLEASAQDKGYIIWEIDSKSIEDFAKQLGWQDYL